jgi:MFS family permease
VPGFRRLAAATFAGRTGQQMATVALLLFVLSRYHSPALAGFVLAAWSIPGLLLSPLAGALLDRFGRAPLIALDYAVAVLALLLVGVLSRLGALTPPLLVAIAAVGSLTAMLSSSGLRTLFTTLVPQQLWPRANAIDSNGWVVATLVGPPVAGTLVASIGPEWTLVAIAGFIAVAAVAILALPDAASAAAPPGPLLAEALAGIRYFAGNRTLSALAATLSTNNLGYGIVLIVVPVLLLGPLQQGPQVVGVMLALTGAVGVLSALVAGRLDLIGHERRWLGTAMVVEAAGITALLAFHTVWAVAFLSVMIGVANGPFDVALFTLRQRRTEPAQLGRAFAISMALNYVGEPLGSAVGGPLTAASAQLALLAAIAATLLSLVFTRVLVPGEVRS